MDIERRYNKTCGCLIGGAAGDALGYPIEFLDLQHISVFYGRSGLQEYVVDKEKNQALISDDTQMTLFTTEGLLMSKSVAEKSNGENKIIGYVYQAYLDWLATQGEAILFTEGFTDLYKEHKELRDWRAPGETCLDALSSNQVGSIEQPLNNSKGCGGLMRIAPVALVYGDNTKINVGKLAAEISAITHGHPLGYIPSAMLAFIIQKCVFTENSLIDCVIDSLSQTKQLFNGNQYIYEFEKIINKAVTLSKNQKSDTKNIAELGEGWVAEETLAIAIYCALKYRYDFSNGIIAAVNHNGDSDSTGSVTGSILGAYLGFDKIENKWKKSLEFRDLLVQKADEIVFE